MPSCRATRQELQACTQPHREDRARGRLPGVLLIHAPNPAFVRDASKLGIFAFITDSDAEDWQSAIDIVLRRFAEYHDLEGAFGRRAVIERAKGILMERHSIDDRRAFEMLQQTSRDGNRLGEPLPG